MRSVRHSTPRHAFAPSVLWVIVLAQAALHLAILPFGGLTNDTTLLQKWAATLASHPVSEFYARQPKADHLPGDLWILKLEAWTYRLVSGHDPANPGFLNALKLGPAAADIGLAVAFFLIAREMGGPTVGRRAALLFAINPAPLFIAMVWGMADSVSMLFAALAILLTIKCRFWAAAPVLAYACLIKPQLVIIGPLVLIYAAHQWLRAPGPRLARAAVELIGATAAAIVVALAVALPFNLGVPGVERRWSLIGRVSFSANLYKQTTMNALNLWAWLAAKYTNFPTATATRDNLSGPLSLSYQSWGLLFSAGACLILTLPLLLKGGKERLILACAADFFAVFMLQTRIHERYFFPAVSLMAVTAAVRPRWTSVYALMSAVYLINVIAVYRWLHPSNQAFGPKPAHGTANRLPGHVTMTETRLLVAGNLIVLAAFIVAALLDLRELRRPASQARVDVPAQVSVPATAWPRV